MSASRALNELDRFPAFRSALASVLEKGCELSRDDINSRHAINLAHEITKEMMRLGSMIALRDLVQP